MFIGKQNELNFLENKYKESAFAYSDYLDFCAKLSGKIRM